MKSELQQCSRYNYSTTYKRNTFILKLSFFFEDSGLEKQTNCHYSVEDHNLYFYPYTQIHRKTYVSGTNTIGKSIFSKHRCVFVWKPAQLNISSSLLIRSLKVKVCIMRTLRRTNIPRRTLTIKLHLKPQ